MTLRQSARTTDLTEWTGLRQYAETFSRPEKHLKHLLAAEDRFSGFSRSGGGLFFDFSRQRIDAAAVRRLVDLAGRRGVLRRFREMMAGAVVNTTEGRAALHTACRDFSGQPVTVAGEDVMPEIRRVREEIREFSEAVRGGRITGSTGKPFRDLVVIGIGGSYLGPLFVSEALGAYASGGFRLHYLANVDSHNFGRIAPRIDPEQTLWIVISKSYTTPETLANTRLAYDFMAEKGLDPARHVVTVTAKGSPGDDPSNPVLKAFHMFDFIGGRYSVASAVGGVPLSLYLGDDVFDRFLKGAQEMDAHARDAQEQDNLPLLAALISIWNNNFLGYPAQAVIPYADPLSEFPAHIQQLYMESNGKSVTDDGRPMDASTGVILFGEPGTNAQHSFFQLAHQGQPFPIDFIGVVRPQYGPCSVTSKGVTNHQELWANLISQPMALAMGKEDDKPEKAFPGNRPSSTLVLPDLSPESVGRLLSFYEARTVFEAFIWSINPFDQFGVELGKTLAADIRGEMAARNSDASHSFDHLDEIRKFYLNLLFR